MSSMVAGSELRVASMEDANLLAEIRKKAILSQPETFWNIEQLAKAANAFDARHIENEIKSGQKFYILNDSAFVSYKNDYLAYLFVLPSAQNSGSGNKLLQLAEKEIAQNHDLVWLWSHPYTEAFYLKHGYIKQPETYSPFDALLYKFQKTFS